MEPATKGSANPTPPTSTRQNKTIQAVLLFAFVVLVVFILALVTNALGTNPTVLTQVTPGSKGTPNAFINNGVQIPGPTLTAIALTPGATIPGQEQVAGSNGSTSNGNSANASGNPSGSSTGNSNGNASGSSTGNSNGANGSSGSTGNSNTGVTGANGNAGATGGSTGGNTGAANGNNSAGSTNGNTGSSASGSLPGGSSSLPGGSTGSSTGSNGSATGANGSTSGSNGSVSGSNGASGSTNGSNGSSNSSAGSASGSNPYDTTGATVHQGNYVCATGGPGNLTYQSDFTILDGQKYKHSANPNQEFSFTYNSTTRTITWVDGPNAGMLGTYFLPDGSHSFQIIEQNKTSDTALSCTLAEK